MDGYVVSASEVSLPSSSSLLTHTTSTNSAFLEGAAQFAARSVHASIAAAHRRASTWQPSKNAKKTRHDRQDADDDSFVRELWVVEPSRLAPEQRGVGTEEPVQANTTLVLHNVAVSGRTVVFGGRHRRHLVHQWASALTQYNLLASTTDEHPWARCDGWDNQGEGTPSE